MLALRLNDIDDQTQTTTFVCPENDTQVRLAMRTSVQPRPGRLLEEVWHI